MFWKNPTNLLKKKNKDVSVPIVDKKNPNENFFSNDYKSTTEHKNVQKIIVAIADYFDVRKEEIFSKNRYRHFVEARHMTIYFLREFKKLSFSEIGKIIGNRDHTTTIYAYSKIKKELKTSETTQVVIKNIHDIIDGIKFEKGGYIKSINEESDKTYFIKSPEDIVMRPNYIYKNITEREKNIIVDWKNNIILEKIAQKHGITRERVRQIVFKTIRQEAINRSLKEGFAVDLDEVVKSEKKLRSQRKQKEKQKPEKRKEKRWSRYYLNCRGCGTTTVPHLRKGYCEKCLNSFRDSRREQIINQRGSVCSICGIGRRGAQIKFGRDLYITKDAKLLCRSCFAKTTGKALSKPAGWSRYYDQCVQCGSTSNTHFKNGYCENCANQITVKEHENIIEQNQICQNCGINREEVKIKFKRDLYITRDKKVLCRKCFLQQFRKNKKTKINLGV